MFNERDITEILSISLSRRGGEDFINWHHSQDGCYSVKTGYVVVVTLFGITEDHQIQGEWKLIWELHVPPKDQALHMEMLS